MKFFRLLSALIFLMGLGFSSSLPVSYFRNMTFLPYEKNQNYLFDCEFGYPPGGAMTLEIRLSNTKVTQAPILLLHVNNATLLQIPITIYAYVFDDSTSALLSFKAYRNEFQSTLQVRIYERESVAVLVDENISAVKSNRPTAEVNDLGVVSYRHDVIRLEGFNSLIIEPVFYAMSFRYWRFVFQHPSSDLARIETYLTIETPYRGFALVDPLMHLHKKIPLQFIYNKGQASSLLAPNLFVHPQTLFPSTIQYEDYIPTSLLFFPRNSFSSLRLIQFKMVLEIDHFHKFKLEYPFTYETLKPLFGSCLFAQYCLGVS